MAKRPKITIVEYKPPETREEFLKERDEWRKDRREEEQRQKRINCAGYNTIMNTRYKGE